MTPKPARFDHAAEGRPVHGRGAVFGLRRHHAHLSPFARTISLPCAGRNRAIIAPPGISYTLRDFIPT
jgi:hypothetical protein